MNKTWLAFLLCTASLVKAQNQDEFYVGTFIDLKDHYPTKQIDTTFTATSIDSLAEWITDTLPEQGLYIYGDRQTNQYRRDWYLIVELNEVFTFYPLYYDDMFDHLSFHEDSSFTADVNADGHNEVFIHFTSYSGHTGWESAIHENWGGLMIIDLHNKIKLLEMTTFYTMEQWWTEFAPDSTETLPYEKREVVNSGGSYECDKYTIWVRKNEVRLQYDLSACKNEDYDFDPTLMHDQTKMPIYKYRLTIEGFVMAE